MFMHNICNAWSIYCEACIPQTNSSAPRSGPVMDSAHNRHGHVPIFFSFLILKVTVVGDPINCFDFYWIMSVEPGGNWLGAVSITHIRGLSATYHMLLGKHGYEILPHLPVNCLWFHWAFVMYGKLRIPISLEWGKKRCSENWGGTLVDNSKNTSRR